MTTNNHMVIMIWIYVREVSLRRVLVLPSLPNFQMPGRSMASHQHTLQDMTHFPKYNGFDNVLYALIRQPCLYFGVPPLYCCLQGGWAISWPSSHHVFPPLEPLMSLFAGCQDVTNNRRGRVASYSTRDQTETFCSDEYVALRSSRDQTEIFCSEEQPIFQSSRDLIVLGHQHPGFPNHLDTWLFLRRE